MGTRDPRASPAAPPQGPGVLRLLPAVPAQGLGAAALGPANPALGLSVPRPSPAKAPLGSGAAAVRCGLPGVGCRRRSVPSRGGGVGSRRCLAGTRRRYARSRRCSVETSRLCTGYRRPCTGHARPSAGSRRCIARSRHRSAGFGQRFVGCRRLRLRRIGLSVWSALRLAESPRGIVGKGTWAFAGPAYPSPFSRCLRNGGSEPRWSMPALKPRATRSAATSTGFPRKAESPLAGAFGAAVPIPRTDYDFFLASPVGSPSGAGSAVLRLRAKRADRLRRSSSSPSSGPKVSTSL